MSEPILLTFVSADGNQTLFEAEAIFVPRVGETVSYEMRATDRYRWNDEAWSLRESLRGKDWIVDHVHHNFCRLNLKDGDLQQFYVYVSLLKDPPARADSAPASGGSDTTGG